MSLELGDTDINKLFLGDTEIKQAYLGDVEVFKKSPLLNFLQVSSSEASLTTYSFAGVTLGDEAADRLIVLCITGRAASGGTIASVTVGGVAATIHINQPVSFGSTGIVSAVVPTGTSGTVVITWSTAQEAISVLTYGVYNVSSTPDFVTGDYTSPLSLTTTLSGETAVIAHARQFGRRSYTWSGTQGVVEDYDHFLNVERVVHSSASVIAEVGGTVIATPSVAEGEPALQVIGFK